MLFLFICVDKWKMFDLFECYIIYIVEKKFKHFIFVVIHINLLFD